MSSYAGACPRQQTVGGTSCICMYMPTNKRRQITANGPQDDMEHLWKFHILVSYGDSTEPGSKSTLS